MSFWRAVALGGIIAVLLPPSPTLFGRFALIGIPIGIYLIAFQWRRPFSLVFGLALLMVLLVGFRGDPEPGAYLWRGWGLLIGGGFVVATALAPDRGLFNRALSGLVIAMAVVAVIALVRPEALESLDGRITAQYNQFFLLVEMGAERWGGAREATALLRTISIAVYPAMIALASVSALCIASYLARLLGGGEAALTPLGSFRFNDYLAWSLIVGLVLLVAPVGAWGVRAGGNIVMFMGGLYVMRGLAVLVWLRTTMVSSGRWIAVWLVAAVLFYPVTLGTALVMGLSDTWLDLRSGLGVEPKEM
ncbi:MAG: hypothetical protein ACC682_04980 [Gemmatimonadota bacterium]